MSASSSRSASTAGSLEDPGEVPGLLGIAGCHAQHASAVALVDSELATTRRRDLERLMDRYPELRLALTRAAADAAARLAHRLEDIAFLSIEERVQKALLDLATWFGEQVESGTQIRLRQQDLADVLGLSRESVSKVLTSPAMHGRLELNRGSMVLVVV